MQAVDQEVLGQAHAWLEGGEACWLATVVATYGSSPRPVGSLLTCNQSGKLVGSLSGGCVEDDLLGKLTDGVLAQDAAQFFRYGETDEEAEELGLPCGGHLDIVIEPLKAEASDRAHIGALVERVEKRRCVERRVDLRARKTSSQPVERHAPLAYDHDRGLLVQTLGPQYQLFIIGCGMVSRYAADIAGALGYDVTICDPRADVLADFDAPAGVNKIRDMPDDAIRESANDPYTAIVALTHDPRIDDMGLMEAVKTEAFYIGAMGSSRTSASRRARLAELDLTQEELDRLHAPIGLPIGSKTPPEIAVAILAEITAVRTGRLAEAHAALQPAERALAAG